MQKFKRFLVEQKSLATKEQGSSIWANTTELPGHKQVALLNCGKKQLVVVAREPERVRVHVPDMDFDEVCEPAKLSREAMRIISEIETYIH